MRYVSSKLGVPPNSVLFGGTVPPNSVLFGGTVPPNSVLFGGTVPPNSFPLFLCMSELALSSDDTLVNIDTEHDDTAKQDTHTTEVVTKVVTVVIVNIPCH